MASDPACVTLEIPDHLHTCGKTADGEFGPSELLFIRFPVEERKLKSVLNFRRQSANRSKYSNAPDDVLYDCENGGRHTGFGVYEISVQSLVQLTGELKQGDVRRAFGLRPEHVPLPCNYPHSEIVAHENGTEAGEPPKIVRKQFREAIRSAVRIVIPIESQGLGFEPG